MFGLENQSAILTAFFTSLVFAVDLVVRFWLLFYIPKRRRPTSALAWLLLIFIIPIFGTLFFMFLGTPKLSRRRRNVQSRIDKFIDDQSTFLAKKGLMVEVLGRFKSVPPLAASLTSFAPTKGNSVAILYGYDDILAQIVQSIDRAQKVILIEFYIMALDDTTEDFFLALERARARGVEVNVLFDAWGVRKFPRRREMKRRLTKMGANWQPILPFTLNLARYNRPDIRNHRKIIVIDNQEAFTGSLNIIDKHYNRRDDIRYTELAIHLRGPSVVQLAAVFASDWYPEGSQPLKYDLRNPSVPHRSNTSVQIVPSGSNYTYRNNLMVFVDMIHKAERLVVINNPYLVPDESLLGALVSAAKRGVQVSILNSEAMDQWMVGHAQRSYYGELLDAGVKIALYKKPVLVHDKFITVDDEIGLVGSSNLDMRSFELNLECVVIAYDVKTAITLRKRHERLLENSYSLSPEAWKKRPVISSMLESITRLSSSLQ